MHRRHSCLAALGLVLALGSTSRAQVIMNGSFDEATLTNDQSNTLTHQGYVTLHSPSTAITGWTVTGSTIDYIGTYWQTPGKASHSLDLDGNNPGGLTASTQIMGLTAGHTYVVTFDLAGNPDGKPEAPEPKSLTVSASGVSKDYTFDATKTTRTNMGYVLESFVFTAKGSTSDLSFSSNTSGSYGPVIGNVSVVPEPATVAMCGMSLLGIAGLAWRRSRKAKVA